MAKNQVVVYHKRAVATHGVTRVFTDGDEPVTGHGKDFKSHATEYAVSNVSNVEKVVGLDAAGLKSVADAKVKAAKRKPGVSTEVAPARLKDVDPDEAE